MDQTTARVLGLFDELIHRGEQIKLSCTRQYFSGQRKPVPAEEFGQWRANCLSLLRSTFGSCSPQFDGFASARVFDQYNATQIYLAMLRGARGDLEKGYFYHKDLMLSVNIFNSLLERARRMIERGETERAAGLIEGLLLEILAKVCDSRKIPHEDSGGVEELCGVLRKAAALTPELQQALRELGQLVGKRGDPPDAAALGSAVQWIAAFLDGQLGACILILN